MCIPKGRQCPTPSGSLVHGKCSDTPEYDVQALGRGSADPDRHPVKEGAEGQNPDLLSSL